MKKLLCLLVVIISLFLAIGCKKEEVLIIYTESGFVPFEYVSDGKIVGVDVDIMNMVGEKLNKKIQFEDVNFDVIVDTVSEGKLTNIGATGLSVTEKRLEKVDFSTVYYQANLYVIYNINTGIDSKTMSDEEVGVYWEVYQLIKVLVYKKELQLIYS